MVFLQHLRESLKLTPAASPWPRMTFCALGTTTPILVGWYSGQLPISIYGAIVAFLLMLNDIPAPLWRRWMNFTLTFLIIAAGLYVGVHLAGSPVSLAVTVFALAYFIGLLGAVGTEFERALTFAGFMLLTGAHSANVAPHLLPALKFAVLGYSIIMVAVTLTTFFLGQPEYLFNRYRDTIRSAMTRERNKHLYAFTYAFSTLLALWVVEHFQLDHGYWAVGSILILMRPGVKDSIYRSFQRLVGTLIGAALAALIISQTRNQAIIVMLIALFSFCAPWSLARAYWLGSGFLTVMILLLMDLPFASEGSLTVTLLRVQATALGCAFTLIAVGMGLIIRRTLRRYNKS